MFEAGQEKFICSMLCGGKKSLPWEPFHHGDRLVTFHLVRLVKMRSKPISGEMQEKTPQAF